MSIYAMSEFMSAVQSDEELARGLAASMAGAPKDQASAFAFYAQARGYEVSEDDVHRAISASAADGELCDAELDSVAGGLFSQPSGAFTDNILAGYAPILKPITDGISKSLKIFQGG